ncbi:MAG: class II glutamine amidotransferase [Patescibacteria group bacterium]|nr:class II glutamine amidotransferase [Patescibacteria group bacterium]MDE2233372.1 class II glutamine amidotransferase [Patescibacteria group bacterium]
MCKLIVGVKTKGENKKFRDIIAAQYSDLAKERDGMAAVVRVDNETKVWRELRDYHGVAKKVEEDMAQAVLVSLHTRTGTTGSVSEKNTHYFEHDGYVFAHNGWINKYHGNAMAYERYNAKETDFELIFDGKTEAKSYTDCVNVIASCTGCDSAKKGYCKRHQREGRIVKEMEGAAEFYGEGDKMEGIGFKFESGTSAKDKEDITDSERFFRAIPKPFTLEQLEEAVKADEFYGIASIVELSTGRTWLIVNKDAYVIAGDGWAIFTSYEPTLRRKVATYGQAMGVPYLKGEKNTAIQAMPYKLVQGCYELKAQDAA